MTAIQPGPAPGLEPGTFRPDPGPAPTARMLGAQTRFELRLLVTNGEQLLLALVIPVAALLGMVWVQVSDIPAPRVQTIVPGIWALAILSAGFTSLAIATAFDRRYAVTRRLIGAGVPRRILLGGKSAAIGLVVIGQLVVISAVGVAVGWRPHGMPASAVLFAAVLVVLGVATFTGLGLLLGGTGKAEVVLGLANLLWLVQLVLGGVVIPLTNGPAWVAGIGGFTPAGALADGLRNVLTDGMAPGWQPVLVLIGWGLLAWAGALQWFKWQ